MTVELTAGSSLGRYELLLPIAKGGMAQVWAARLRGTRGFQKLVAVKTILAGAIDNTRLEQMFLEEAQLASQIHHPNVVGTLELGEHEDLLYLVMEWVDGESLAYVLTQALEQGGLPMPVAVNLIGQACQGLHAAHELRDDSGNPLGVVHRDVSPQNILVTFTGTAKLVDFGIAKATGRAGTMTQAGEIKGKFAYMAPEQVRGEQIDRRADLFALGILAYLLTTGKHPFRGDHPAQTIRAIVSEKPPLAPSVMNPDYPAALEGVIMRALEKDPARRFASGNEMLAALEAAMPEALEATYQAEVTAYLRTLLGTRESERHAAIRKAQELADRKRALHVPSSGTLRAISLDSIPDSTTPAKSLADAALAAEDSASNPFAAPAAWWRRPGVVALGAGSAVAALLLLRTLPERSAEEPAAANRPPFEVLSAAQPSAQNSAAVSASPSPANAAVSAAVDERGDKSKSSKSSRVRAGSAKGLVAARPVAPSVAARPVASSVPTAPKAGASSNAWDRDAFGGRH